MNIRIATRKSQLALWQARYIQSTLIKKYPTLKVSLVEMTTEGDQRQDVSLNQIGGKSLFVKTLQNALRNNEADIAVHCVKDMSVQNADGLILGAICEREDPRDVLISPRFSTLSDLPSQAIVGTSSPRRTCLLHTLRDDLQTQLLRGNVDTRLKKVMAGEYDAIILAAAGLHRLGLSQYITDYFSETYFTPAIGQGALGIECRENDAFSREIIAFLNHENTARCVKAERAVNRVLGGDCHDVIGAYATIVDGVLILSAMVGTQEGKTVLRAQESSRTALPEELGASVADQLIKQGALELLR